MTPIEAWRIISANLNDLYKRRREPCYKGYVDADIEAEVVCFKCLQEAEKGIVRCKDCEHWGGITFGNICRRWSAPLAGMTNCTKPDDYCSYGKKKE